MYVSLFSFVHAKACKYEFNRTEVLLLNLNREIQQHRGGGLRAGSLIEMLEMFGMPHSQREPVDECFVGEEGPFLRDMVRSDAEDTITFTRHIDSQHIVDVACAATGDSLVMQLLTKQEGLAKDTFRNKLTCSRGDAARRDHVCHGNHES